MSQPDPADLPTPRLKEMFWKEMRAITSKGPWVLAVSGGSDSVALMRLASQVADDKKIPAPIVVTVDHGLRNDSAEEAVQVAEWAGSLGLHHHTLTWTGAIPQSDIQSAARDIRYRLMGEFCRTHGLRHLLTAHTQDDQAETFLLRLARGSGVDGLAGMRVCAPFPVSDYATSALRLCRPLLHVSRHQLQDYLRAVDQSWIEDPSNANEQFARVRMRRLMPALAQEGLTAKRLARTSENMRFAHDALADAVANVREQCVTVYEAGYVTLDPAILFQIAPRYIGQTLLADLLMCVGGAHYKPRFAALTRLYDALRDASAFGQGRTLSGCRIVPHKSPKGEGQEVLICREMRSLRQRLHKQDSAGPLKVGDRFTWDNRFDIWFEGEGQGQAIVGEIRPLGVEGVRQIRAQMDQAHRSGKSEASIFALPSAVRRTLPALWDGDRLVACTYQETLAGPNGENKQKMAQMRTIFRMP